MDHPTAEIQARLASLRAALAHAEEEVSALMSDAEKCYGRGGAKLILREAEYVLTQIDRLLHGAAWSQAPGSLDSLETECLQTELESDAFYLDRMHERAS